jgi:hypothetical protein
MFIFSHMVMVFCILVIVWEVLSYPNYSEERSASSLIQRESSAKPRPHLTMIYLSMIAIALGYLLALQIW